MIDRLEFWAEEVEEREANARQAGGFLSDLPADGETVVRIRRYYHEWAEMGRRVLRAMSGGQAGDE